MTRAVGIDLPVAMPRPRDIVVSHGFQPHYTVGFCNGLAANGVPVVLIASGRIDASKLDPRVEYVDLKGDERPDRSRFRKLADFARYHARLIAYIAAHRHSTVHIIGLLKFAVLMGVIENLLLRLLARRLMLTVHNLVPHDCHSNGTRMLYKVIYRIPAMLVVHTEKMKQELQESFDVPEARIVVMEHGVNNVVKWHDGSGMAIRAELGATEQDIVLLMFGKLAPYKGVDILIDAFEKLDRRYHLLIAGHAVSEEYDSGLRDRIRLSPAAGRICYINGYIPDEDVAAYFDAADVLVMPYMHIDQSGVLFLGMSAGIPIVAFDAGMFRRYVAKDIGVVVSGKDAESLAHAIIDLDRSKFDREHIRRASRRYEWANVVKAVLPYYSMTGGGEGLGAADQKTAAAGSICGKVSDDNQP